MKCLGIVNILDLYAEKRLTEGRRRQVEEHLKDCRACASESRKFVLLESAPKISAPPELKARLESLLGAAAAAGSPATRPEWSPAEALSALAAAAACAVLISVVNWTGPGLPSERYLAPSQSPWSLR